MLKKAMTIHKLLPTNFFEVNLEKNNNVCFFEYIEFRSNCDE